MPPRRWRRWTTPAFPRWPASGLMSRLRIIQYKMSMKRAKWLGRFPMQDEHETGKNGVGVARPGASAYAECREPKPGSDPGVSPIKPTDRVCGLRAEREIRLGGERAEGAELRQVEQA